MWGNYGKKRDLVIIKKYQNTPASCKKEKPAHDIRGMLIGNWLGGGQRKADPKGLTNKERL